MGGTVAEKNVELYNLVFSESPLKDCLSENNLYGNLNDLGCGYELFPLGDSSAILMTKGVLGDGDLEKVIFSDGILVLNKVLYSGQ